MPQNCPGRQLSGGGPAVPSAQSLKAQITAYDGFHPGEYGPDGQFLRSTVQVRTPAK